MEGRDITKKYSNGELTVLWKPKLCIHAAECVKALPHVYNPNEKPWIKAENATTAELMAQINKCPSGALSYERKDKSDTSESIIHTRLEVIENGPLIAYGDIKVVDKNGVEVEKTMKTAFCRCGASANKPYCDGTHKKEGFIG